MVYCVEVYSIVDDDAPSIEIKDKEDECLFSDRDDMANYAESKLAEGFLVRVVRYERAK